MTYPLYTHGKSLLWSIAFAVSLLIGGHYALAGDIIGQQQQQGQIQGQYQTGNVSNTNRWNDERQLAPVFVAPPSFGAAVSSNSCAGTEAWSVGLGGAFFVPNGTGAPVSAGVGFGSSDVITINLCEVREAANLAGSMGDYEMAQQILCQHPSYYRAAQAIGRPCAPTLPYKMEVVTEEPETKPVQTASAGGSTYCEFASSTNDCKN